MTRVFTIATLCLALTIGTQVSATAAPKEVRNLDAVARTATRRGTTGLTNRPGEGPWRGPCDGFVNGETDTGATPLGLIQRRTRHLVACVFDLLAPSQTEHALYIANRESHFGPMAYNPSGSAGVFQHLESLWTPRSWLLPRRFLAPFLWRRWAYVGTPNDRTVSPFNAYANVWVTALMVVGSGWGPWGG